MGLLDTIQEVSLKKKKNEIEHLKHDIDIAKLKKQLKETEGYNEANDKT